MGRPRKAPRKQAYVPEFAHDELEVFLDELNKGRRRKVTAPDMLGALMLAVQRLPLEVADALLPAYQEREQAEIAPPPSEGDKAEA
jgi:hypothetical protein